MVCLYLKKKKKLGGLTKNPQTSQRTKRIQNQPRGHIFENGVYISLKRLSSLYLLGSAILKPFPSSEAHGLSKFIFTTDKQEPTAPFEHIISFLTVEY